MSEEKNQNEIEEVTNEDEHKDVEHYCCRNHDQYILDHNSCACSKVNDQHDDHKHLEVCLKFSPVAGCNNDSIVRGNQTKSTDNKFSCNNDDCYNG